MWRIYYYITAMMTLIDAKPMIQLQSGKRYFPVFELWTTYKDVTTNFFRMLKTDLTQIRYNH